MPDRNTTSDDERRWESDLERDRLAGALRAGPGAMAADEEPAVDAAAQAQAVLQAAQQVSQKIAIAPLWGTVWLDYTFASYFAIHWYYIKAWWLGEKIYVFEWLLLFLLELYLLFLLALVSAFIGIIACSVDVLCPATTGLHVLLNIL